MHRYYSARLAGERLRRCYALASPRVRRYLEAEIAFDAVVCVQNGICAFRVPPDRLVAEALRVTRPGGCVLLSSYADAFWPHRLAWFEAQATAGLLGPIDRAGSRRGTIVCRDGFRSGTFAPEDFRALARRLGLPAELTTVDGSSVFCRLARRAGQR